MGVRTVRFLGIVRGVLRLEWHVQNGGDLAQSSALQMDKSFFSLINLLSQWSYRQGAGAGLGFRAHLFHPFGLAGAVLVTITNNRNKDKKGKFDHSNVINSRRDI